MIAAVSHLFSKLPVTLGMIVLVSIVSLFVGFKPSCLRGKLSMHRNCVIHRGQIWRMLTFHFVHVDLRHLCLNLLSFYLISSSLERMHPGTMVLILFYAFLAALTGIVYVALDWSVVSRFSLGFSVFVYCLLGIFAFRLGKPDMTYILFLAVGVVVDLLVMRTSYQIDHRGHFAGFLTGSLVSGLGLTSLVIATFGKL